MAASLLRWIIYTSTLVVAAKGTIKGSQEDKARYASFTESSLSLPCGQRPPETGTLSVYDRYFSDEDPPPVNSTLLAQCMYPSKVCCVESGYSVNNLTGELTIVRVKLDNEGDFTCQVVSTNPLSSTNTFSHLTVYVTPQDLRLESYNESSPITAIEDTVASFRCVVGRVKPANIKVLWKLAGNLLCEEEPSDNSKNNDGSFRVVSTLNHVFKKSGDGKVLGCEAIHGENNTYTDDIGKPLTVYYQYMTDVKEKNVNEKPIWKRTKSFICDTASAGSPVSSDYVWYKDGQELTDHSKYSGLGTNQMNITNLEVSDNGVYSCSIINLAGNGKQRKVFVLKVLRPPSGQPTILPAHLVIPINANNTLFCNVSALDDEGFPTIYKYHWYKDGKQLPSADESTLKIYPELVSDGGSYTCVVENDHGKSNRSRKAVVVVHAPVVIEENRDVSYHPLYHDETFSFNVTASGTDIFGYIIKNGSQVLDEESFMCSQKSVNGSFSFGQKTAIMFTCGWVLNNKNLNYCKNVTYFNSDYRLLISGKTAEETTSDTAIFSIDVYYKPVRTEDGWEVGASVGSSQRLECDVCSNPPPLTYHWTFNGQHLPPGIIKENRTLVIGTVQEHHFGDYTCKVCNEIEGTDYSESFTKKFYKEGPPDEIRNLDSSDATSKSALITWTTGSDGGCQLLGHELLYRAGNLSLNQFTNTCRTEDKPCDDRLWDLQPDSHYSVQVRAKNSHPNTSYSNYSSTSLKTQALPHITLTTINVQPTYLEVGWLFEKRTGNTATVSVVVEYKMASEKDFKRYPDTDVKLDATNNGVQIPGKFNPKQGYDIALLVYENDLQRNTSRLTKTLPGEKSSPMGLIVGIVVGILVLLVLIALVVIFIWRRRQGSGSNTKTTGHSEHLPMTTQGGSGAVNSSPVYENTAFEGEQPPRPPKLKPAVPILRKLDPSLREMVKDRTFFISFENIKLKEILGTGYYGNIQRAVLIENRKHTNVVVKELSDTQTNTPDEKQKVDEFFREAVEQRKLTHPNVLTPIKITIEGEARPYVVLPRMEYKDLHTVLGKGGDIADHFVLDVHHKATICLHISKGMEYLAEQGIIHRDLWSKNVLINQYFHGVVTGFGVTCDVLKRRKDGPPYRWLAVECLDDQTHCSTQSDVWAFGITMSEIFSREKEPYNDFKTEAVISKVKERDTLPDLSEAPSSICDLVRECLSVNPETRPQFNDLSKSLETINRDKKYEILGAGDPILSRLSTDLLEKVLDCQKDFGEFKPLRKLGKGKFGEVWLHEWHLGGGQVEKVALKSLHDANNPEHVSQFLWEGVLTVKLKHPNVLQAYGVCIGNSQVYIILPNMEDGDLKDLLRNKDFPAKSLIKFAMGIAKGMQYLSENNYIHRDLATRNILVTDNCQTVRIADFGLACELLKGNYYRMDTKKELPVKWMAPESLKEKKFTTKSDVWSYGVTLWEIFSKAEEPYEHVLQTHITSMYVKRYHLQQPDSCPPAVYKIMEECWRLKPETRPTFEEISAKLEQVPGPICTSLIEKGAPYLKLM